MWVLAVLAYKDYFKTTLKLEPGSMQAYTSIIHIPWSLKIIYGLISDNVPIFGYRRKSYIVIMGLIQFIALYSVFHFQPKEPIVVALIITAASLS
jgi:hypothetical protein